MARPITLPLPMSIDDRFRQMMKDPAVRRRIKRDPKYAAKLWYRLDSQMRSLPAAPTSNMAAEVFRRAPLESTLQGNAAIMVEGDQSLAAVVRAQRDSYLIADGSQVAGDYTAEIRKEQGGLPVPRMPTAGYAAASYPFPTRKMVTGAALAATPMAADFTNVRRPLPTSSFNPGAFVTARPDSLSNSLTVNQPVPMARPSRFLTPSEARRDAVSTLMGLGALPADPYQLILEAFKKSSLFEVNENAAKKLQAVLQSLTWTPGVDEARLRVWQAAKCTISPFPGRSTDGGNNPHTDEEKTICFQEFIKGAARGAIAATIMADSIDLNILPSFDAGVSGKKNNELASEAARSALPEKYRVLFAGLNLFPLDLTWTGVREAILREAYEQQWGSKIQPQWFDSLSNELANLGPAGGSGSLLMALSILRKPEYSPTAVPPPSVKLKSGIAPPPGAATGGKRKYKYNKALMEMRRRKASISPALLIGGGVAAVALIGLGIYLRKQ